MEIQTLPSSGSVSKITPRSDTTTRAIMTEDFSEAQINSGNHFIASSYDSDVDIAGPKYWKIITSNTTKWVHMNFIYSCSAAGLWEIYENPTYGTTPGAGTELAAYNNNRNSATASGLTLKVDPTLGSGEPSAGTLVWSEYMAAAGMSEKCNLLLKQNEDYLIVFTADGDNTKVNLMLSWYEHTNET
jgi:hypothetical protein